MISCQPKVCSSFIVYGICYLPRGVYTTHYLGGVSHTLLVLQTSGVVQPILSLGMIFLDTLNELWENGQYSLKWVLVKEGEKEDTGRGSWASFDIRTAKPDDPVPGLLDKVIVSQNQKSLCDIVIINDNDNDNLSSIPPSLNYVFHAWHNRWTLRWWTHWTRASVKKGDLRASSPSTLSRMSGTCWRGGSLSPT